MYKRIVVFVCFLCLLFVPIIVGQAQGDVDDLNAILSRGSQSVAADRRLVDEDFSDSGAWESYKDEVASIEVRNNELRLGATDETTVWTQDSMSYEDVIIVVAATQLSDADDNEYGVMCRADQRINGEGYYFSISGDGFASIQMFEDGAWTFLEDWITVRAINQGQDTNDIVVVCYGSYLALYVNGTLALQTEDDTFSRGQFGFFTTIFEANESVEIAFDDVQVYDAIGIAGTPTSINNYAGDWEAAIAELEDLGLIGNGGSLIFNENRAFFDGIGYWFEPLARRSSHRDVVVAATLDFTTGGDDYESCGLIARVDNDPNSQTISTYLEVGFDNNNTVYWLDSVDGEGDFNDVFVNLDLDEPHHLLFLALNDELTIYIDGELIFDSVPIESRNGSFGITLIGTEATSRCEGTNVWAYAAPIFVPGLCEVLAGGTVNRRSGPGTNFDRAGTLNAGQRSEVVGQATGSDGFIWYKLEDDAWVREDIISLQGDCASIPEVDD